MLYFNTILGKIFSNIEIIRFHENNHPLVCLFFLIDKTLFVAIHVLNFNKSGSGFSETSSKCHTKMLSNQIYAISSVVV